MIRQCNGVHNIATIIVEEREREAEIDGLENEQPWPVFVATGELGAMAASVGKPDWVQADDCITTIGVAKEGGKDGDGR